MEVNESLQRLVCNHCDHRAEEPSFSTPEEREEGYDSMLEKVSSYKIKRSVTFELKSNAAGEEE